MFKYKATFFGGGGGGGKTTMGLWCMVLYLTWLAFNGFPGAVGGVFGETMDAVKSRDYDFAKRIFPEWLGEFVGGQSGMNTEFRACAELGGWRIVFRISDNFEAKERSTEYAIIFIDESTNHTHKFFKHMLSRMRWTYKGREVPHTPMLLASNPSGIGVSWHLDEFVETYDPRTGNGLKAPGWKSLPSGEKVYFEGYNFIKALIQDNPHLGAKYELELASLPDIQRAIYYEGNWHVLEKQFFRLYSEAHQYPSGMRIPLEWPRFLGVDYGMRHAGGAYAAAVDFDGNIWVFAGFEATGLTIDQFKLKMHDTFREPNGEPIEFVSAVADPTMFAPAERPSRSRESYPAEVLRKEDDNGRFFVQKAVNDRIPGWHALQALLDCKVERRVSETGTPYWHVLSMPKLRISDDLGLFRAMQLMERKEGEPDDLRKTTGEYGPYRGDEGSDILRYLASKMLKRDRGEYIASVERPASRIVGRSDTSWV